MDPLARFPQPKLNPSNLVPLQQQAANKDEGEEVLSRMFNQSPQVAPLQTVAQQTLQEQEKKPEPPKDIDDTMYTDIDLSDFFLSGIVKYTVKICKQLDVTFRLLSASEVADINNALYNDNNLSANTALVNHAVRTLAYSVTYYGATDVSKNTLENKINFFKSLPALLVNEVAKRYSIFEQSVGKMLADTDFIKN